MADSLVWRAITHRRMLLLICIGIGLLLLPLLLMIFKPTYNASAHVMLVSENTARDPLVKGRDVPVLALSFPVLTRAQRETNYDGSLGKMRGHLAVRGSDMSNMLTVTFRDHDAKVAADVANAVSKETVEYYHRLSAQQYDRLISFLRGQMVRQRDLMAQLDHKVQHAASADTFVSSDKAIDTITARLDDLQGKLGDAMAALTADRATAAATGQQPQAIAGVMQDQQLQSDPLYQNLRNTQARDAAALGAIKSQYTDKYPGLPSLAEQVRIETRILNRQKTTVLAGGLSSSPAYAQTVLENRKAEALVAGDEARVAQYNTQIGEQQRRLIDLGNTGVSVAVLRTERDAAMASYGALSTQLSTALANQAEASSLGSLVIVDPATDASALFETLVSRIVVGVIAVFAMAFILAVIVEVIDPRLRTPNDIERLYGQPVIASVGS